MEWYQGGIAEGVTLSRKEGSIFVVYIEGKDDKSKQMTQTINTSRVANMLKNKHFVAIRIEAGSVTHQQFAEIYKSNTTPSIYFIGKTGLPLEVITEAMNPAEMIEKVNEIVVKNGGTPIEIANEQLVEVPVESEGITQPEPQKPKEELNPLTEPPEEATAEEIQASIEAKLKLAQELIAQKRKAKEEEEKEKERNKEVERRRLGQDVQKMKRWQQDQELKQMMDERQKAKREEQEARDRVKRQIEEDKREKAARMTNYQPNQAQEAPRVSVRAVNSDTARLQFRLPDGSQVTQDFKSSACLREVIDYLQTSQNQGQFRLSTTFPKREFTANDASQTLLDLQLVPNAVVLVLPSARGAVITNTDSTGMVGMFWYLLSPILTILDYLKIFIFGTPKPKTAASTETHKRTNSEPQASSSGAAKRRVVGEGNKDKKQGNVHRLHDHDSDEDNNTWNGNSTQQM